MLSDISHKWWLFLIRGLVAIIFGILALTWPEETWLTLVVVCGVLALMDGFFNIITGIDFFRKFGFWWVVLLEGTLGIAVGFLTLLWPKSASNVLFYFIATWAVIKGCPEIMAATWIRHWIKGEWSMILAGTLSIILGILLFVEPGAGLVGLVWVIGLYAIVFGIMLITLAFRLLGLRNFLKVSGLPVI